MSPVPWRAIFAGLGVLAILALAGWLYWRGHSDAEAVAKPKIEAATDDAVGRGLEAQGERETVQRVEVVVRQARAAEASVAALVPQIMESPDAETPWPTLLAIGCALMTTACVSSRGSRAVLPPPPPRLAMPAQATEPCSLYRLPDRPTKADLEIGYATRGAQIVECDGRRRLAVDTAAAEHALEDRWAAEREARNRPWWKVWVR